MTSDPAVTKRDWVRWLPYAVAGVLAVFYAAMAVNNHLLFRTTGYDLGIFEQAVRAYAEFRAPVSELRGPGFVLLGDHFHPILMVLAPFYKVFPSALTLLVAQAVLVALSAVPVTRLAAARFDVGTATVVGVAYGLSWGLLAAVDFDFHEVVFAVPILAFCLEKLANERWVAAACWAAPLVLVKEDLPLTVIAIGGYLVLKRQWKLGAAVAAFGAVAFALIVLVVIPAFNPGEVYSQGQNLGSGGLMEAVRQPSRLVTPDVKLHTLVALLAPTAFLAMFSPMAALVLPTLLWRFLSVNPNYWGTQFHYSAVLMPIIYVAFIQVLHTARTELRTPVWRRVQGVAVVASVVAAVVGLNGVLDGRVWKGGERVAAAERVIDKVPVGVEVAASNRLAPHLTADRTVQLFPAYQGNKVTADWVIVDTRWVGWPSSAAQQQREFDELRRTGYRTVADDDGFVVLHRER